MKAYTAPIFISISSRHGAVLADESEGTQGRGREFLNSLQLTGGYESYGGERAWMQ